jgi:putative sugar O-methyltransferase
MQRINVTEDPGLLDRMLEGQDKSGYRPSVHWEKASEGVLSDLRHFGITEILWRPNPYGGISRFEEIPHSLVARVLNKIKRTVFAKLGIGDSGYVKRRYRDRTGDERFNLALSHFVETMVTREMGESLLEIEDSLAGNPSETFQFAGKTYSQSFLYYFSRAQWLLPRYDLPQGAAVVEIGSGYGGFAEVMKKLRPDLRYVVIDIVPQLYVVERRLKAVFGDTHNIVGFDETKDLEVIDLHAAPEGSIFVVPVWKVGALKGVHMGVNQASMQEMRYDQSEHYIRNLAESGMMCFFSLNFRPGIGSMTDSTTTEFLIECFGKYGYQLTHLNARRAEDGIDLSGPPVGHDHAIFVAKK